MKPVIETQSPRLSLAQILWRSNCPLVAARGLALFLGGFTLLNLCGELFWKGFDANLWWIDLRAFPHRWAQLFLGVSSLVLLAFGIFPKVSAWRKNLSLGCAGFLALMTIGNALRFYMLLFAGQVKVHLLVPLSVLIAASLVFVLFVIRRNSEVPPRLNLFAPAAFALMTAVLFTVAQMFAFGKTDYRRPADVAVVLGARVYANGRLSNALSDRVATACELYRQGYTRKLLMSGGPGDGVIDEPEAMKQAALKWGVPEQDILLDHSGLNTSATVRNTEKVFSEMHVSSVLVVSHFYHLPRIKMAYARAGREVFTVPAKEKYFLRQIPYNMVREVAALWVYYLKPMTS